MDFYRRLAGREHEAVVLKMMDKNIEVVAGLENGNVIYVDAAKAGQPGPFQTVTVPQANRAKPVFAWKCGTL